MGRRGHEWSAGNLSGVLSCRVQANFGDATRGNFLVPGTYTINGPGGKDVGAFTATTQAPGTPFVWPRHRNLRVTDTVEWCREGRLAQPVPVGRRLFCFVASCLSNQFELPGKPYATCD